MISSDLRNISTVNDFFIAVVPYSLGEATGLPTRRSQQITFHDDHWEKKLGNNQNEGNSFVLKVITNFRSTFEGTHNNHNASGMRAWLNTPQVDNLPKVFKACGLLSRTNDPRSIFDMTSSRRPISITGGYLFLDVIDCFSNRIEPARFPTFHTA